VHTGIVSYKHAKRIFFIYIHVKKGSGSIETFGNKCFVGRGFSQSLDGLYIEEDASTVKTTRPKPEKVNLKFGKIRVSVTSAKRVRVKQEDNAMVIFLED